MPIAVSACLLGEPCRYDGKSRPCEDVLKLHDACEMVPVCPEVLGGLPVPHAPCEIAAAERALRVTDADGVDVTDAFLAGAAKTVELAQEQGCKLAVLKAKSPSCGCGLVYDGARSPASSCPVTAWRRAPCARRACGCSTRCGSRLAFGPARRGTWPGTGDSGGDVGGVPCARDRAPRAAPVRFRRYRRRVRLLQRPRRRARCRMGPAPHARGLAHVRGGDRERASCVRHLREGFGRGRRGATGPCIGSIGLIRDPQRRNVDCLMLGYALARTAWGRGCMTEAADEMLRYGFEELGLGLITCTHYTFNDRSRRVIEKAGFVHEGTIHGAEATPDGLMQDFESYYLPRERRGTGRPFRGRPRPACRRACGRSGRASTVPSMRPAPRRSPSSARRCSRPA